MRKGIIDIGTNTFNLLVVEFGNGSYLKILHEEKLPVKLGKGSMNDGILKTDAMERGINALNKHLNTARKFNVSDITTFATSAVRSAKNKNEFIEKVKKDCGLELQVITGDEEAKLIYNGVKHAVNMDQEEVYLILDIGGGSNEFIICDHKNIYWQKSYDLGMARMLERINPGDPVNDSDIRNFKGIIDNQIEELIEQCNIFKPQTLLGASGSFETFTSIILHKKYGNGDLIRKNTSLEIFMEDFLQLYDQLVKSTAEQRKQIPGLPEWRIDMIVLAAVFTKYIIDSFGIKRIVFSDYSLKEGVVFEMI